MRSLAASLIVLTTATAPLIHPDGVAHAAVDSVVITRIANYTQTSSASPPALNGYTVLFQTIFNAAATGATASVQKPNGTITLALADSETLSNEISFPTLAAMNAAVPKGTYTFNLGGSASGSFWVELGPISPPTSVFFGGPPQTIDATTSPVLYFLPGDTPLPPAPVLINFDAAQKIDALNQFTLWLQQIPVATTDDKYFIEIDADDGTFSFTSPALDGTTEYYSLLLPPAKTFTGGIAFAHVSETVTLPNSVTGLVIVGSATQFTLQTPTAAPHFTLQPIAVTPILLGDSAQITASAYDPGYVPGYQWQRAKAGTSSWSDLTDGNGISGSSTTTLGFATATADMTGDQVRCVATNPGGSTTSAVLTIRVGPAYATSTLAGAKSDIEHIDGPAGTARFSNPIALACDASGTIYVAEPRCIRKVNPSGDVSTLAGTYNVTGNADGSGTQASFTDLIDVAVDRFGNVYASDRSACTIRKVTPAGVVSTLAGTALMTGSVDAVGATARFGTLGPIGVDDNGNVYVADVSSITIRKIKPDGTVSTLAGLKGQWGLSDGTGSAARFHSIAGLTVSRQGVVYVAEKSPNDIRRISPNGTVTTVTLTGAQGFWQEGPGDIAVDDQGYLFVTDFAHRLKRISPSGMVDWLVGRQANFGYVEGPGYSMEGNLNALATTPGGGVAFCDTYYQTVRLAAPVDPVAWSSAPSSETASVNDATTLTAAATGPKGARVFYQWRLNGIDIPGATSSSYAISNAQLFDVGVYSVVATSGDYYSISAPATVSVSPIATSPDARLLNLSTRALSLRDDEVLIPGFVINGTGTKHLLIRAVGPTLGDFGVSGTLPDPQISLYQTGALAPIGTNDDWESNSNAANIAATTALVGAFPLALGSADSALLVDLAPGQYSAVTSGVNNGTGVAIVELYDADSGPSTASLVNISNRGFVGSGDYIMIPGFVVSNEGPRTFLIRAVGPTLASFNVGGTLSDPVLTVFKKNPATGVNERILSNDNWGDNPTSASTTSAVAAQVGAFALQAGSTDAAFVVTLAPGIYSVQASGKSGATGVALVEIYLVP